MQPVHKNNLVKGKLIYYCKKSVIHFLMIVFEARYCTHRSQGN